MAPSSESSLLAFYRGTGSDDAGRWLKEMRQWPDERLEHTHDYIQWMFPLRERSQYNCEAPVLDERVIAAFLSDAGLRSEMFESLQRMLAFYGLEWHEGAVRRTERFAERSREWVTAGNHNHLRITRMLKSLTLLGLGSEARAFFYCLTMVYDEERGKARPGISAVTFRFWSDALLG
ncbi:opioid growth factor receptor-related protein [Paludibaculum fermentans]|uniref:opioid growth factor receptor-related protein n=1 Tax=Paludibaculum fermentans TaxID=1473598 RepID=UPI003EBBC927